MAGTPIPKAEDSSSSSLPYATTAGADGSNRMAAHRVAKACLPCSTKKRRCDGGKPECKVCMVLGTPCSYESRGLKRGPPKGFRSGPRESARAKLLRTLETTIRDLSLHIGADDAKREIDRISSERGVPLAATSRLQELRDASKRSKRELSAPVGTSQRSGDLGTAGADELGISGGFQNGEEEEENDEDDDDDSVLGINDQGAVRHFGSSSGMQLLQQQHQHPQQPSPGTQSSHSSNEGRNKISPRNAHQHIQLPSVSRRLHYGSSPTSYSNTFSPTQGATSGGPSGLGPAPRKLSRETNRTLFEHYWEGFHNFWPILYKPALQQIGVDDLPDTLDAALLNAIYAIAACIAHPSLVNELEAELGDGSYGEIFAQRAEVALFSQQQGTPIPSFASIQTCFLLSCYYQGIGQLSKAYILSSLANSMAVDLGLHRHLHHYENDSIERESRSRLIHCIYIMSTLLSAEMGRPPMLRSKDIDVPPLGEQEQDEFDKDALGRQLHTSSLLNSSRRLFAIVETVLSQVHSFRRKAALRRMGSESVRRVVDEIDESLETWRKSLPAYLKLPEDDPQGTIGRGDVKFGGGPVPSFAAVQAWYYTAKLLLHRPFIPQDEGLSLQHLLEDKYHQKCTHASQALFDLLLQLAKSSEVEQLSTDLAYIIFTAAVMFVFNARLSVAGNLSASSSSDQSRRTFAIVNKLSTDARRQFTMCKEWLKRLSERWPAASAHKQLLEGFAVIGEGVVGGEPHTYTGRRPSLVNGSLIPAALPPGQGQQLDPSAWAANVKSDNEDGFSSFSGASSYPSTTTASEMIERSTVNAPVEGLQQAATTEGGFGAMNFFGPFNGPETPVAPQQSLNAYFNYAPNIFDMENVYWNETTTRLTPYFGPQDGSKQGGARADLGQVSMSSFPPSSTTATSGDDASAFLAGSFTPRTQATLNAVSNYANIGNYGPPQLPLPPQDVSSTLPASSSAAPVRMGPPSFPASNAGRGFGNPPSIGKGGSGATGGHDGLQLLAHQAITSAPPSGPGSAIGSSNRHEGISNLATVEGVTTSSSGLPSTGAGLAISPFSFHQEPSAPEWGDVISMLQLPPAFIQ